MRIKDLYGEEGEIVLDQLEKREHDYFAVDAKQERDLIQLQEIGDATKQRSSDIGKLVSQMNELAVIFKELSILVVEQGTVLDRIDYNIQEARHQVKKANVELEKTLEKEKSFRARGCMSCLVTGIFISLGMLVLKHMA